MRIFSATKGLDEMDGKYDYDQVKREISGFGGGYEAACRRMVLAGLAWCDEHPQANPLFHGYRGIMGIISEDNEDAKLLTAALLAAEPDCSGAMHQAAVQHTLFIRKHGWEAYVAKMNEEAEGTSQGRQQTTA